MIFKVFKVASGVFAIISLVAIVSVLFADSLKVLSSVSIDKFVTGSWNPSLGEFNLLPMVIGGLTASVGSLVFVAPIAALSAIAIQLFCPRLLAIVIGKIFALMSGIPSVIFGLWGLGIIVPSINNIEPPGASLLAASIVLAFIVLPSTILLISRAIEEIPMDQVSAANSLSLSLLNRIHLIILPNILPTVLSILCVQFARALGETMAVVMVAGNIPAVPKSIFDPIRTLTGHIALEMPYAEGLHRSSLMLSGLLLCLPSLILFYLARRYLERLR